MKFNNPTEIDQNTELGEALVFTPNEVSEAQRKFISKFPHDAFDELEALLTWEELSPHRNLIPLLQNILREPPAWIFNKGVNREGFDAVRAHFLEGAFHVEIGDRLRIGSFESNARCRAFSSQIIQSLRDLSREFAENTPSRQQVYEALQILRFRNIEGYSAAWLKDLNTWAGSKGESPVPGRITIDLYGAVSVQSIYLLNKLNLPFTRMSQDTGEDFFPKGTIVPKRHETGIFLLELHNPQGEVSDRWVIADSEGTKLTYNRELFKRVRGAAGNFTMALLGQGPFSFDQAFSERQVERRENKAARSVRAYVPLFAECGDWKPGDKHVAVPSSFDSTRELVPGVDLAQLRAGKPLEEFNFTDAQSNEVVCKFRVLGVSREELRVSSPQYQGKYASWENTGARLKDVMMAHRWLDGVPGVEIPPLSVISVNDEVVTYPSGTAKSQRWATFMGTKMQIDGFEGDEIQGRYVVDQKTSRRMIAFWPAGLESCQNIPPLCAVYSLDPEMERKRYDYQEGGRHYATNVRVFERARFGELSLIPWHQTMQSQSEAAR